MGRREWLAFWLCSGITLLIYLWSLAPTVTLEDSGELAVAAHWMGIPHPPGYPFWTFLTSLIVRLFPLATFRGYPNPAWGAAFASALYGSLACGLLAMLITRIGRQVRESALSAAPPPPACRRFIRPAALPVFLLSFFIVWNVLPIPSLLFVLPLGVLLAGLLLLTPRLLRKIPAPPLPKGMELLCGLGGGLLLALSPLMWSQSVIIEVYSLNALFIALLMVLGYQYLHAPHDRILHTTAFVFALGLSNHQALAFLGFFLLAGLLSSGRFQRLRDFLPKIPLLLLFTLAGLSFHAYLPLASRQNPPMNWGYARSREGFQRLVTRGQYEGFELRDNLRQLRESLQTVPDPAALRADPQAEHTRVQQRRRFFFHQLGAFFWDTRSPFSIARQFSFTQPVPPEAPSNALPKTRTLPFALIGLLPFFRLARMDRRNRAWLHCSAVGMFFLTVVFLIIQFPQLDRHDLFVKRVQYIQAHVFFAMWMGLGGYLLLGMVHGLLRKPILTWSIGILLNLLFVLMPLQTEFRDPAHRELLGSSSQRGHDFGWRYGTYLMRGMNGILLDELSHHPDPLCLLNDKAMAHLQLHEVPETLIRKAAERADSAPLPRSRFRRHVLAELPGLTPEQRRHFEEAAMLAHFRSLPRAEQEASLRFLHQLPPRLDYPPELSRNAILFGGTDPGRFVPTYLIFSARMRPDIFLFTQNALADASYLNAMRDLYGDRIHTPSAEDSQQAFRAFADHARIFQPDKFAALLADGDMLEVSGVDQVNHINFNLTRLITGQNRPAHPVYIEESYVIPWMNPRLRPTGLIFRLEEAPVRLRQSEVDADFAFWDWMISELRAHPGFDRNVMARKSWSKLRAAQAAVYAEQRRPREAERAFRQALRIDPVNPETLFRFADFYTRQLRFTDAAALVAGFAEYDPRHPQLPVFARGLEQLQQLDARRMAAEERWDLNPTGNLILQLVQIYGHLEQVEPMRDTTEVLLGQPNLAEEFYPFLADFLRIRREKDLLQQTLETWAARYPDSPEPWIELAVISLSDRRIPDLMRQLDEAIRLDPQAVPRQLARDPRFLDIRHWQSFQQRITSTQGR